jgi:alkylation response protein AidB-like acyl-CoA dehydrogenase
VVELEFTSDQEELRASVRSFLEKECPTEVVRAAVATGEADQLWASMVALDWPGLTVPEEFGGIGLTFVEAAVVAEELGRVVAPGPLFSTLTQFAPLVREVGDAEQQHRFLSAVASGALTGTLALADHAKAWSLDDVTLVAERVEGGWVLDGIKLGLLGISEADGEVAVLARVGDGFGAFVVPAAEAGLAPVRSLDASRPLATATLRRVTVGDDRALGEPGGEASERGIRRALDEATAALALETVGACDTLFQFVLAYVKERKQFGVPVGSFQAIKHKMADMFLAIERARSLCYYAVAAIDEDTEDRAVAVSMAKAASDDCQRLVCREAFQSFGGIGFTWEHDSHLFIKRAETSAALLGGAAEHSVAVAASLGILSA